MTASKPLSVIRRMFSGLAVRFWVGFVLLALAVAVAAVGPLFATQPPDKPIGIPGSPPSAAALLGTDVLGRDVLSRVLHGGESVLTLATSATLLGFLVGAGIGLVAGYRGGWVDTLLMRAVDLLLAFPALVVAMLLVGGLGRSAPVLVVGAAVVQWPAIARVARAATLDVRQHEFIDAAISRGERTASIIVREVLPNIAGVLLSSAGMVFGWCVIVIASMNYLGLGLEPPQSDWGLMIAENQPFTGTNPASVLAPTALLAMLSVGINLLADGYARRSPSDAGAETAVTLAASHSDDIAGTVDTTAGAAR